MISKVLKLVVCWGGVLFITPVQSYALPAIVTDYLTTQSIEARLDAKTTKQLQVLSTDARSYLEKVLPSLPEPNKSIVQLLLDYPEDGAHDYWWPRKGESPYDGSTTDVLLNNVLMMKGEPGRRTFCCGLTLEVFYRYLKSKPAVAEKISRDPAAFKRDWFCRELFSPGPRDAMEAAGVGNRIVNSADALPGDFVQIWRNDKSGHSVILVNWLWDGAGQLVGLQYWSTQTSTKGIGFSSETFGTSLKQINPRNVSVSRPLL